MSMQANPNWRSSSFAAVMGPAIAQRHDAESNLMQLEQGREGDIMGEIIEAAPQQMLEAELKRRANQSGAHRSQSCLLEPVRIGDAGGISENPSATESFGATEFDGPLDPPSEQGQRAYEGLSVWLQTVKAERHASLLAQAGFSVQWVQKRVLGKCWDSAYVMDPKGQQVKDMEGFAEGGYAGNWSTEEEVAVGMRLKSDHREAELLSILSGDGEVPLSVQAERVPVRGAHGLRSPPAWMATPKEFQQLEALAVVTEDVLKIKPDAGKLPTVESMLLQDGHDHERFCNDLLAAMRKLGAENMVLAAWTGKLFCEKPVDARGKPVPITAAQLEFDKMVQEMREKVSSGGHVLKHAASSPIVSKVREFASTYAGRYFRGKLSELQRLDERIYDTIRDGCGAKLRTSLVDRSSTAQGVALARDIHDEFFLGSNAKVQLKYLRKMLTRKPQKEETFEEWERSFLRSMDQFEELADSGMWLDSVQEQCDTIWDLWQGREGIPEARRASARDHMRNGTKATVKATLNEIQLQQALMTETLAERRQDRMLAEPGSGEGAVRSALVNAMMRHLNTGDKQQRQCRWQCKQTPCRGLCSHCTAECHKLEECHYPGGAKHGVIKAPMREWDTSKKCPKCKEVHDHAPWYCKAKYEPRAVQNARTTKHKGAGKRDAKVNAVSMEKALSKLQDSALLQELARELGCETSVAVNAVVASMSIDQVVAGAWLFDNAAEVSIFNDIKLAADGLHPDPSMTISFADGEGNLEFFLEFGIY